MGHALVIVQAHEGDLAGDDQRRSHWKNEQVQIFHYKYGEQVCALQNFALNSDLSPSPSSDGCVSG